METSYLIKLLKEISDIMAENKDKLIEMDGIVGDGVLQCPMDSKQHTMQYLTEQSLMQENCYLQQEKQWRIKFLQQWDL